MPQRFGRPAIQSAALDSFVDEAGRLRAFVPPFRFTAFFSPEDTLLCAVASEAALAHARTLRRENGRAREPLRIAELTTGSGLVGLHLLRLESGSTLLGLDVDPVATDTAARNARALGLASRTRFECADIWSDSTVVSLDRYQPHLMICNPPYVPEPHENQLAIEAGAGPEGTAHLFRTLELCAKMKPRALALSWCSLSDPAGIVREASNIGYSLDSLFVVALSEGEYSGRVRDHLRSLPYSYINEGRETVDMVAPDGSGRFAYLLMAGNFSRTTRASVDASAAVERMSREFAEDGLTALRSPVAPVPVRAWILDRWDELRLRAFLHGEIATRGPRTA